MQLAVLSLPLPITTSESHLHPFILKMENPRQSTSALCRTLAHALKRLFKSVKARTGENTLNGPADIIRRVSSPPPSLLPRISQVSMFPEFESPDIFYDDADNRTPTLPMTFHESYTTQELPRTLLPARSLSHFNLQQVYADHCDLPVLPIRKQGHVWPAEQPTHANTGRVPAHKPVLVSKKSTLQIRRPVSFHASIVNAGPAASIHSDSSSSMLRRTKGSGNLRKCAITESLTAEKNLLTPIAEDACFSTSKSTDHNSFRLVKHFASYCIMDMAAPGCPISAVSEDLGYLYDIKDRFVLNAHEISELSMDLTVGRDPHGNEVTYLLLFSPLISPATTKSRFMLVSAIDVSGYIRYAATLEPTPEPRRETKYLNSYRDRTNLTRKTSSTSWIHEKTDQLADELLHGCSIKESSASTSTSRRPISTAEPVRSTHECEDIWTAIAREEGLMTRSVSTTSKSSVSLHSSANSSFQNQEPPTRSTTSQSGLNYADEKVVETFIDSLQVLYSQYFLLACSPLNGDIYEICYVSPAVYESGEYVSGHLSHTPFNLVNEFAAHLVAGKRFRTVIRWGVNGVKKQLYCVPLMGHEPAPWICMLVGEGTPIHW